MTKLNYQTKLIILIIAFLLFATGMFMYGYGILSSRNRTIAESVAKQRKELGILEREQKSFEEGKKDLAQLASSTHPPAELFSSDTKVVKEIQQIEQIALRYNLKLKISVSGTAAAAPKVPGTTSDLYSIPYTITLDGTFEDSLLFMQSLEAMQFNTHVTDVTFSVSGENVVRTTLSSEFYIKK